MHQRPAQLPISRRSGSVRPGKGPAAVTPPVCKLVACFSIFQRGSCPSRSIVHLLRPGFSRIAALPPRFSRAPRRCSAACEAITLRPSLRPCKQLPPLDRPRAQALPIHQRWRCQRLNNWSSAQPTPGSLDPRHPSSHSELTCRTGNPKQHSTPPMDLGNQEAPQQHQHAMSSRPQPPRLRLSRPVQHSRRPQSTQLQRNQQTQGDTNGLPLNVQPVFTSSMAPATTATVSALHVSPGFAAHYR